MGYRVLIVEDETIIRKGLLLSVDWAAEGCELPAEAGDGREALERIESLRPDIVLMDINLPIISGLDVLEQSMESCGYSAIIITGFNEFEYARRALRYGVTDFLLKPLDPGELLEALRNAKLERRRRQAFTAYEDGQQELLSTDLLSGMTPEAPGKPVQQMLELLRDNLSDKITLRDISEKLNYSETYLIRKFKSVMGTNFSDYLNRLRIQKALSLLREGERDLQKLADCCGFSEYKYFSLVFRKYTGCSPREYAKIIRQVRILP